MGLKTTAVWYSDVGDVFQKSEEIDMCEDFAIEITDKCDTREQWLAVVNYGRGTLIREPKLMMEVVVRRAEREHREQAPTGKPWCVADYAAELCGLLTLEFC